MEIFTWIGIGATGIIGLLLLAVVAAIIWEAVSSAWKAVRLSAILRANGRVCGLSEIAGISRWLFMNGSGCSVDGVDIPRYPWQPFPRDEPHEDEI